MSLAIGYQLSPQLLAAPKVFLKDIKIASTSGDYDSIASTPPQSFDLNYGLPVFVNVGSQSAIQNFVNTLKSKFKLPRRLTEPMIPEATPSVPPRTHSNRDNKDHQLATHHMYVNTGPNVDPTITLTQVQMKLDDMVRKGDGEVEPPDQEPSSPTVTPQAPIRNVSLAHSKSLKRDRVFLAQKKRSGSYHILNIEDIWKHQLENRYAPLSIIKQRPPSPSKLRKGASLKSRRSYIRDRLLDTQENKNRTMVTDYEVPLHIMVPPAVIPPPMVLKRMSQCTLARQDAMCTDPPQEAYDSLLPLFIEEEVESFGRMVSTTSEPCLSSLSSNDYDYLEDISIPPSSHNSSCMASPSKHPLERFISVPPTKFNHSDDYDHMWDEDTDHKQ